MYLLFPNTSSRFVSVHTDPERGTPKAADVLAASGTETLAVPNPATRNPYMYTQSI